MKDETQFYEKRYDILTVMAACFSFWFIGYKASKWANLDVLEFSALDLPGLFFFIILVANLTTPNLLGTKWLCSFDKSFKKQ